LGATCASGLNSMGEDVKRQGGGGVWSFEQNIPFDNRDARKQKGGVEVTKHYLENQKVLSTSENGAMTRAKCFSLRNEESVKGRETGD